MEEINIFVRIVPLLIIEKRVRSKEIGPWGIWSERDAKGKRESERKREWM